MSISKKCYSHIDHLICESIAHTQAFKTCNLFVIVYNNALKYSAQLLYVQLQQTDSTISSQIPLFVGVAY